MDAYLLDGALYCAECAPEGAESFPDGGGESDTPVHCDTCHAPFGNPLTGEGIRYALEGMRDELAKGVAQYSIVHPCYAGTYYGGSPHVAITSGWARQLKWCGLPEKDARFVTRFLSWTSYRLAKVKGLATA